MEHKKSKILVEKVEILDESTGQIILKEQARVVFTSPLSKTHHNETNEIINHDIDNELLDDKNNSINNSINESHLSNNKEQFDSNSPHQIIIFDTSPTSNQQQQSNLKLNFQSITPTTSKQNFLNSGLSSHIAQNYSILAQEITSPLDSKVSSCLTNEFSNHSQTNIYNTKLFKSNHNNNLLETNCSKPWFNPNSIITTTSSKLSEGSLSISGLNKESANTNNPPITYTNSLNSLPTTSSVRAQKDMATCQFCGRAMLKKNIPTHIRRAHTPKEELVCLNVEQNIFTFHHLKPGQRRKRSARAYDYSLMTATVSIDEDPCEGIENKFITEGEEILSTDLLQLADRIKYGISQIPTSTLTKLIDILTKIEQNTQDEINSNAKAIKNMICFYLTSSEEFKYKIKQVGEDIVEKTKQVNDLRADLKEVMTRKAQLERRIQPLVCELQKLEDQHGNLIESALIEMNDLMKFEIINENNDSITS